MRYCLSLALLFAALLGFAPASHAVRTETIAAVVNDDAVSASDVAARAKLIMVSSGLPDTAEMREKIVPQILSSLIEEKLMLQEAARLDIKITDEDIQSGLKSIADQNKFTVEQFTGLLQQQGIAIKTLEDQIRAQMSWSRVVQERLRSQVEITPYEVDAARERLRASIGKAQYLISEIVLPVDTPKDDASIRQLADRLLREMMEGRASFPQIASQFSQSAGAAKGGDRGWMQEGQLPSEIESTLAQMKEGEVSRPVRTMTGYHILLLRKKSALTEETLPSADDVYNKLGHEQLDRLQRRYLLDLKSAAFIERRV